jgi:hypothetical protein
MQEELRHFGVHMQAIIPGAYLDSLKSHQSEMFQRAI